MRVKSFQKDIPYSMYLGDDLQPCVDLDICEAVAHSVTDVVMSTILEPEGQQSQSVLQGVHIPQRD